MSKRNLIGGDWVEGTSTSRNVNPSDTNDVIGIFAQASADDAEAAVAAARAAFPVWSRSSPQERHDVLSK